MPLGEYSVAEEKPESSDIFGIRPFADSVKILTEGVVKGAGAFLSRICLPAAEEFGLLLKDKVSAWRAQNTVNMLQLAEKKVNEQKYPTDVHAPPRLVFEAIQNSSWVEDKQIQEMWAGLLASSCTPEGKDESNLIFMNILSQLTSTEVKILNYACEKSRKRISRGGWIFARKMQVTLEEIKQISELNDEYQIDRELDHLRSLGLIGGGISGGFSSDSTIANITPSALALNMYVRVQGYTCSPLVYFDIKRLLGGSEEEIDRIIEQLKETPILKRKDVASQYKGKRIELKAQLRSLYRNAFKTDDDNITISFTPLDSYCLVRGEISLKSHPELKNLLGEEIFIVKGTIIDIDTTSVELGDIQIKIIDSEI
jgi:hypothetical protein